MIIILDIIYSINGKEINRDELKNIKIVRQDYIEYVESLKKDNNFHRGQK